MGCDALRGHAQRPATLDVGGRWHRRDDRECSTQSVYARVPPVRHLSEVLTGIAFNRRDAGQSGRRIEHMNWSHYVAQGRGLLHHLGFDKAYLIGRCLGCYPVTAFVVAHPETVLSLTLFWPEGGARYRLTGSASPRISSSCVRMGLRQWPKLPAPASRSAPTSVAALGHTDQ
jgi:pimeloyl-ACP methyl ester carboxylesterase